MYEYNMTYPNELYHYGVKGMKWGVRRYQNDDGSLTAAGKARQGYKDAKKEVKAANKELRRAGYTAYGIKGINRYDEAEKKAQNASLKALDAKAKYNSSKSKNAEKAELNTYTKAMFKTGLPGSAYDKQSGSNSKRLYDHLTTTKGKTYADSVAKKVQRKQITALAVTATAIVGSQIVSKALSRSYGNAVVDSIVNDGATYVSPGRALNW